MTVDTKETVEFNWDFPEPEEFYGEGRYYSTGDDWKRAHEVNVIPSYDQETFNNGMDLLLFRILPLIIVFALIGLYAVAT